MDNLPEPVPHRQVEARHRTLSPSLVRAAVSPTAVAVVAVGAGIGVADHSAILAVVLAAGGWLSRMGAAVIGGRRRARAAAPKPAALDPWSVPEPWRQLLQEALSVQSRFDQTVANWPAGPIRDHLGELQPRVWAEVDELGAMARRGAAATGWTGATVGPGPLTSERISEDLRRVQAERGRLAPAAAARAGELTRREEALAAQLRARYRAERLAADAQDRLRSAVARLDGAVTDLIATGSLARDEAQPAGPGPLDVADALDGLSDEIGSLRAAIAETSGAAGGASGPPGAPPDRATP